MSLKAVMDYLDICFNLEMKKGQTERYVGKLIHFNPSFDAVDVEVFGISGHLKASMVLTANYICLYHKKEDCSGVITALFHLSRVMQTKARSYIDKNDINYVTFQTPKASVNVAASESVSGDAGFSHSSLPYKD